MEPLFTLEINKVLRPYPSRKREKFEIFPLKLIVEPSEIIGILGRNGNGKTTLLSIMSQPHSASAVSFNFSKKISFGLLLGLGDSFDDTLTGLQNIQVIAKIGSRAFGKTADIGEAIKFCELGEGLNDLVSTYSSGMRARLAFSCLLIFEHDVYLIDEAIAVGDIFFQQKCFERILQLRNRGTSILVVTHDLSLCQKIFSRCLILEGGRITFDGDPIIAMNQYLGGPNSESAQHFSHDSTNSSQCPPKIFFHPSNTRCEVGDKVLLELSVCREFQGMEMVISVNDRTSMLISEFSLGTVSAESFEKHERSIVFDVSLTFNVAPSEYTINAKIARREGNNSGEDIFYYLDRPIIVVVFDYNIARARFHGLMEMQWSINKNER